MNDNEYQFKYSGYAFVLILLFIACYYIDNVQIVEINMFKPNICGLTKGSETEVQSEYDHSP